MAKVPRNPGRARLVALLVSLLPSHLVRRHGREIVQAALHLSHDPRYARSRLGGLRFWFDFLSDLARAWIRSWSFRIETVLSPADLAVSAGPDGREGLWAGRVAPSLGTLETANDRLKKRAGNHLWSGLIAATLLHFLLLAYFPELGVPDWSTPPNEAVSVLPPPPVDLPPEPTDIRPPAHPVITTADIPPDVTLVSQDQLWERATELPPPPMAVKEDEGAAAVWLGPSMVAPRLLNRDEVDRALESEYPPLLRDSGIGGRVVLHVRISVDGVVLEQRLHESSGHSALDRAAGSVVDVMRFAPAINRDQPVSVWVALPVTFTIR